MGTKPTKPVSSGQALDFTIVMAKGITRAISESGIGSQDFQTGVLEESNAIFDFCLKLCRDALSLRSKDTECISYFKSIEVKASSGERTIVNSVKASSKLFISTSFKILNLTNTGKKTDLTKVIVCKLFKDATFREIFSIHSRSLESLVFTQHQIVDICRDNLARLHSKKCSNYFLIKNDDKELATENNLFVVRVDLDSFGLSLFDVYYFNNTNQIVADWPNFIFIPDPQQSSTTQKI